MADRTKCPECGGKDQFQAVKPVGTFGGDPPNFLPGLGRWFRPARFEVVVCHACGFTRWYAEPAAREKLRGAANWKRVG